MYYPAPPLPSRGRAGDRHITKMCFFMALCFSRCAVVPVRVFFSPTDVRWFQFACVFSPTDVLWFQLACDIKDSMEWCIAMCRAARVFQFAYVCMALPKAWPLPDRVRGSLKFHGGVFFPNSGSASRCSNLLYIARSAAPRFGEIPANSLLKAARVPARVPGCPLGCPGARSGSRVPACSRSSFGLQIQLS